MLSLIWQVSLQGRLLAQNLTTLQIHRLSCALCGFLQLKSTGPVCPDAASSPWDAGGKENQGFPFRTRGFQT